MINLTVKSSDIIRTVNADITDCTKAVFDRVGVDPTRAQVTINGTVIGNLDNTFERLGVVDGKAYTLRATVKSDGSAE